MPYSVRKVLGSTPKLSSAYTVVPSSSADHASRNRRALTKPPRRTFTADSRMKPTVGNTSAVPTCTEVR